MTAADIQAQFRCRVLFADDSFALPTLAWLRGPFWSAFQRDRWEKVGTYSRRNDCDNFARAYAQLAQDCHAKSRGTEAEALAVGEVWYVGARGAHAIVCAFTDVGRVFIEPQDNSLLTLTESELFTCTFARF